MFKRFIAVLTVALVSLGLMGGSQAFAGTGQVNGMVAAVSIQELNQSQCVKINVMTVNKTGRANQTVLVRVMEGKRQVLSTFIGAGRGPGKRWSYTHCLRGSRGPGTAIKYTTTASVSYQNRRVASAGVDRWVPWFDSGGRGADFRRP